jgi:hypothetical protein
VFKAVMIFACGWVLWVSSVAYAVPTGLGVVLFTGLGSGSTPLDEVARDFFGGKTGEGLQNLGQEFAISFPALGQDPATLVYQVFPWDEETQAGDFVRTLSLSDELVIVGHSFGADSSLHFAKNIIPDRNIDLLVTIDDACVTCPGGTTKPSNVRHEIEFYHDPNDQDDSLLVTPFLRRLSDADQSINVTSLFNEPDHQSCLNDLGGVVIHTNISDSDCVHRMIVGAAFSLFLTDTLPDVTTFLAQSPAAIPEPSTWCLLVSGLVGLKLLGRRSSQKAS